MSGKARTAMIESSARTANRRLRLIGSEDVEGRRILRASTRAVCVGPRRLLANSVGTSSRPARTNKGSPRTLRSRPRDRDTAGGERCSRAAAPTTEPVSRRASRTRRRLRSMSDEFINAMVPRLLNGPSTTSVRVSSEQPIQGTPMNPQVRNHRHCCCHRNRAVPERISVSRPPEHKTRHRGQRHGDCCCLVRDSFRASWRATVGTPVVLDVMEHNNSESK